MKTVTIEKGAVRRICRRLPNLQGAVLLAALLAAPTAVAELERAGPVSSANGYPAWYQDKTGLALELSTPTTQSELDGGWTLLLPGDTVVPEVFPTSFFDEHFYWSGGAGPINFPHPDPSIGTSSASLVLALEAAFGGGPAVAGDQVVFGRVRIRINEVPYSGDYRVYTPYGVWDFPGLAAGERLFFTEDIGIAALGDFNAALNSSIGPFLLPSVEPGGPELPPIPDLAFGTGADPSYDALGTPTEYPGTGKKYIADPARVGPVTGSPRAPFTSAVDGLVRNHNIFRIEGPEIPGIGQRWVLETTDFALTGRLFEGAIPGRVTVDRAVFTRTLTQQKVEVFATGLPTTLPRLPTAARPGSISPILAFYNAPPIENADGTLSVPTGATENAMSSVGNLFTPLPYYWGQVETPIFPAEVTVVDKNSRNAQGQVFTAVFRAPLGDQVTITEAVYDPTILTLSVKATSSDALVPPVLTLGGFGELAGGQILVTQLLAPPSKVRVLSSAGGASELQVSTLFGALGVPVLAAVNDALTIAEDAPVTSIAVLANDTYNGLAIPSGAVVAVTGAPLLGVAHVNPDNSIDYTPRLNASGSDILTYTVTLNGNTATANVLITITPVNDPPVAVNDSVATVVNALIQINVLANDTDVDTSFGGTLTVVNVTAPAGGPAGSVATATVVGNNVDFTANTAGTYTFTYQVQDGGGLRSAPATVTVTVATAETIVVTLADFRTSQLRFRITGTDSVRSGQSLGIKYANGTDTTSLVALAVVDATGAWAVEIRNATGIQDPRNSGATAIKVTSALGGTALANIAIRR